VDFSTALGEGKRPTLAAHVEEILRLGTVGLLGFLNQDPGRSAALAPSQKAELLGLAMHYYDGLPPDLKQTYLTRVAGLATKGWAAFRDAYNSIISVLRKEKIEPADWSQTQRGPGAPAQRLRRFWYVAHTAGVESVWVMVDGVDEEPSIRNGRDIFECVAELLLSQSTIEFRDNDRQVLCFKFFLSRPAEVQSALLEAKFRTDRVKTETILWTRADLDQAFQKRLAHFSNKRVLNFDDLCAFDAKGTHSRLLDVCELTPRTLFRMAHEIFNEFELRSTSGEYLVNRTSIESGIRTGQDAVVK
jgi:hypothetical protein